jgi:hypothetical protein
MNNRRKDPMNPITVETTGQTVHITFDKTLVPMDFLTDLLRTLEIEYLAKTVNFSDMRTEGELRLDKELHCFYHRF